MSNLPPYTHEELRAMSFDLLMNIQEKNHLVYIRIV